jgi:catechol 2,3-dioxygenase-like lactoylglutathione lyase family enzyme
VIDHVSLPVSDLEQSTKFYEPVLSKIGFAKLIDTPKTVGFGRKYPELWLNHRPAISGQSINDGFHVCLRARSVDDVKAFHEAAIAAGAENDGAPGPRPHYSANYYAAFIRDLDGNRLEVVNFVQAQ